MQKIILIPLLFLQLQAAFSQIKQYFFFDDVEVVEYVYVKVCIGENGETVSVTENLETTTYTNKEIIQQIIDYRKGFDFLPETKFKNQCFNQCFNQLFTVVNTKYETLQLVNANCYKKFKNGKFQYLQNEFKDVVIKRRRNRQIEKTKESKSVYQIEWVSPCNYILTHLKVEDPESKYLIGQKIDVKIIDILEDGSYLYYSNLSDRTYGFGILKKL